LFLSCILLVFYFTGIGFLLHLPMLFLLSESG